jgi:hypothetical protein
MVVHDLEFEMKLNFFCYPFSSGRGGQAFGFQVYAGLFTDFFLSDKVVIRIFARVAY